jgi:murein L,D-transpeptidase YafK
MKLIPDEPFLKIIFKLLFVLLMVSKAMAIQNTLEVTTNFYTHTKPVQADCYHLATGIYIQTKTNTLNICEDKQVIASYKIAIGREGIGKISRGDNKTPLGLYHLGFPRLSTRFGIFIPINYPTEQQILQGYSGANIGIHGPFILFRWLGNMNTYFNWTKGCVAVGTNKDIQTISDWVKKHFPCRVFIE